MAEELVFYSNLTDEEIHERFKNYDYSAALRESLQEMLENECRLRGKPVPKLEDLEPVASANDIGYSSFQDPRLQPPEYDEPEEESIEELIEFSFDEIVHIDQDGSWTYEDQTYAFAANPNDPDGKWYTEQDNILFRDVTDVVEDLDSIMEPNMPMAAGTYRISGDAELHYTIHGVFVYRKYYDENDFDQMIDTDNINVELKRNESYIKNFQIHKV